MLQPGRLDMFDLISWSRYCNQKSSAKGCVIHLLHSQIGFYSLFVACLVVRSVPIMFAGMLARSSWRISAVITCVWQVEFVLQSEVFDMLAVSFRFVLTLASWTV